MAFNETVMRFAFDSPNAGPLEGATHSGVAGTPGAGRYIKIDLRVSNGIIEDAKWQSNGCPAAMASASVVCNICEKKLFSHLIEISSLLSEKDVIVLLDGLPEGKEEMAQMAVDALRNAIERG